MFEFSSYLRNITFVTFWKQPVYTVCCLLWVNIDLKQLGISLCSVFSMLPHADMQLEFVIKGNKFRVLYFRTSGKLKTVSQWVEN